jgi:cytochrome c oxidase cbb3-type subunit 4
VLLAMFVFFLGAGVWAFWPSQRANRQDAAEIPFRNETRDPKPEDVPYV